MSRWRVPFLAGNKLDRDHVYTALSWLTPRQIFFADAYMGPFVDFYTGPLTWQQMAAMMWRVREWDISGTASGTIGRYASALNKSMTLTGSTSFGPVRMPMATSVEHERHILKDVNDEVLPHYGGDWGGIGHLGQHKIPFLGNDGPGLTANHIIPPEKFTVSAAGSISPDGETTSQVDQFGALLTASINPRAASFLNTTRKNHVLAGIEANLGAIMGGGGFISGGFFAEDSIVFNFEFASGLFPFQSMYDDPSAANTRKGNINSGGVIDFGPAAPIAENLPLWGRMDGAFTWTSADKIITELSITATLTMKAAKFWPYNNSRGEPVYHETTGVQIRDFLG